MVKNYIMVILITIPQYGYMIIFFDHRTYKQCGFSCLKYQSSGDMICCKPGLGNLGNRGKSKARESINPDYDASLGAVEMGSYGEVELDRGLACSWGKATFAAEDLFGFFW